MHISDHPELTNPGSQRKTKDEARLRVLREASESCLEGKNE
jgi:hypothetical protein